MSAAATPQGYPGNPSLPKEVREKILSTFRHTLNLFKEGKQDDCLIGCDFILKMDPRFSPARQLMEKAKNPAAAVDVNQLEKIVAETPTRQERVTNVDTDRLLVRAVESYNAREFDTAIAAADAVLEALPGNQSATAIREKALRKKEAQPQFDAARQRAIAALDARRPSEARAALEKMRSLDAEHPAVALLERRLQGPPDTELGESTNPGIGSARSAVPEPESEPIDAGGGLGDLSLDSLSLDEPLGSPAVVPPPPDFHGDKTGPLSLSDVDFSGGGGAGGFTLGGTDSPPPDLWSGGEPEEPPALEPIPAAAAPSPRPAAPTPEPPSADQEIAALLARGDDAARAGNRQQAIEIWSRIFLIDINNSEAVGRIEKARQEMAEGNRRVAEALKRGRESFEAGDMAGAREAFLQVLAIDENDQTARSYLDKIEHELARPSAGLDLSKKAPAGDILAEEMAQAAETAEAPAVEEEPSSERVSTSVRAIAPPKDRRFLAALAVAALLAAAVGGYFLLRSPRAPRAAAAGADGGASLEHATALFREGKIQETIAELRRIAPEHPDYARAQKLLTSLTRRAEAGAAAGGAQESAAAAEAKPTAAAGPPPEAVHRRQEAEQALAEKRYIDALKSFNLAAPAFEGDPTFAQSMGAASEKVNELTPAVKLYNEGEFDTAIPILWRIFQSDRSNQDARSYLVRSYFNQGVGQLQNGLYGKASESFREVLAVDANDADAIRHKKFAERYAKGDLDLMGRIYVRHLQQRP